MEYHSNYPKGLRQHTSPCQTPIPTAQNQQAQIQAGQNKIVQYNAPSKTENITEVM